MFTNNKAVPAADGQLGGVLKAYRDWRISGDTDWLKSLWPKIARSLDFCISYWDPRHTGLPEEPQHNTYDIEFWGPNGMCGTFYLAALEAACRMGQALGEDSALYADLYAIGRSRLEQELFNGEYFEQKVQWKELDADNPADMVDANGTRLYQPELISLLETEGPKYQYGRGCLADGVLGSWLAEVSGIEDVTDRDKTRSHLMAVHKHNLKRDLIGNFGTISPTGASGEVSGLLVCTWPKGGRPAIPVIYDFEVWPGIEYQVASHLMLLGCVEEGLDIVRCVRQRHDGRFANPFDETEHPHWYGRILSSYSLLQGLTGARYDAVERVLYIAPRITGDFRSFLATAKGYGTAGVRNDEPFLEVMAGRIEVDEIRFTPCPADCRA